MPIFINNAVVNVRKTPGIITGVIAERPASAPDGLIFISTDTQQIFSYRLSTNSWVLVGSTGGGATPTLDAVVQVGNNVLAGRFMQVIDAPGTGKNVIVANNGISIYNGTAIGGQSALRGQAVNANSYTNTLPTANGVIVNSVNGVLADAAGNVALPISSGTYTPVLSDRTNVADEIINDAQFLQVGNTVTVSGMFQIESSVAFADTSFNMTLPIASAFASVWQCSGSINSWVAGGLQNGIVSADFVNSLANIKYVAANDSVLQEVYFQFTYLIV